MRIAFGVGQPKKLPLARTHTCHRWIEHGLRVDARQSVASRQQPFRNIFNACGARPSPVVAQEIGRNSV